MTTQTIEACPACGHSGFRVRNRGKLRSYPEGKGRYRCDECSETFDEPAERPLENNRTPKTGLAARLADDDVTGVADLEGSR